MLTQLLTILILLPVLGFVGCILTPLRRERVIFTIAISVLLLELVLLSVFGYVWIAAGAAPVTTSLGTLYESQHYTFSLDFYFDTVAAIFSGMAAIMITLVALFSKYYLHREQGFKRFYATLFLFFVGLLLVILAGNFEVLFIGWEFIGISSVLLIAFYRDRFLPARNALKVFSVYRIGDAFLLAALLYAHHLFEQNIRFSEFSTLIAQHGNQLVLLGLLLLVVALVKSAQFPFSYWLPRAMEGPTTSSAIFYGALSVHMGLFLLLRTYPLWEGSVALHIIIAVSGLVTAIVATSIARVQSSAKTQIAYSSIAQIGIMFIELAAGLHWLVLLHFVSNAALRTYQLLISPSIVSYLVHDQFFYFVPPTQKIKNTFMGKIRGTFYVLGIKEWDMNTAVRNYLWGPLKSVGRVFSFLDKPSQQAACFVLFLIAASLAATGSFTSRTGLIASTIAAVIAGIFHVRAYATKSSAATGWNLIALGHLFTVLFLMIAAGGGWQQVATYGAGVLAAFIVGHGCLRYIRSKGESDMLSEYHGLSHVFAGAGNIFFVAVLFFIAFPISPSFLAQDILLSSIPSAHAFQIVLFCLLYLVMGVSALRLFTKVFFGPYRASHHEKAYRSS